MLEESSKEVFHLNLTLFFEREHAACVRYTVMVENSFMYNFLDMTDYKMVKLAGT